MTSERVAFCVFCDDVRPEVGNKLSLMGLYSGDMIAPGPAPAILSKLCIVLWIIADIDDPPQRVGVRVLMPPDESERMKLDLPPLGVLVHPEGATRLHAQAVIPMTPFRLEHEGFIQVMVDTERETLRAGRLMVRFVDPAGSPEPAPPRAPEPAPPRAGAPVGAPGLASPLSPPVGQPGRRPRRRASTPPAAPSGQ